MAVDSRTRDIMIGALERNLGYRRGETVALIGQTWEQTHPHIEDSHLPNNAKPTMDRAMNLFEALEEVYRGVGVDVKSFQYQPSRIGSTVEPTKVMWGMMSSVSGVYGLPKITIAPTAYSLTHTNFMTKMATQGSRIATMSNSSLAMFSPGGPFDSQEDPAETSARTEEIANKLRESEYVRVGGPNSNLIIHVNPKLVHADTGIITEPGEKGNWLGAEAYVVPVDPRDGGRSHGWFTVPAGWGGREQLKYGACFWITEGRFKKIVTVDEEDEGRRAQQWLDENVAPRILPEYGAPEDYDIVAELGFGTNTAINADYLRGNWSIAVAEKMYQTERGRTVHIAEGNSSGMGGRNNVKHHEDWLVLEVEDIEFGYKPSEDWLGAQPAA